MFISINLWFIWIEAQAGIFIIFYIFIIFVADEDMEPANKPIIFIYVSIWSFFVYRHLMLKVDRLKY